MKLIKKLPILCSQKDKFDNGFLIMVLFFDNGLLMLYNELSLKLYWRRKNNCIFFSKRKRPKDKIR